LQVSDRHYQLILSPDINQPRPRYQWFYFELSNNEADVNYTFEIINYSKGTSMFSHGMQPVMFSVTEAVRGKPAWKRAGSSISYCRNTFCRNDFKDHTDTRHALFFVSVYGSVRAPCRCVLYSISFSLHATLERHLTTRKRRLFVRCDKLCTTLAGNEVPLLTITASGTREQIEARQIAVLCARVHPGESNSSWVMHGVIDVLMSEEDKAVHLRNQYVFKIIPMLNIDGVVNGSHRCSLAGVDLNRTWDRPSPELHPPIFHTKAIVQYMVDVLGKKPFVFIDLHGHSQHFNECDYFSLSNCRFSITREKESSGRVTLWRQFGVTRSYTIESTYAGFNTGPRKGFQVNIEDLLEIGNQLCKALKQLMYIGANWSLV
uniref:Peptidase_M14 domain-containing protein n=1 Tax=Gongylonema pulchrum TaxID=637853 RepID=A0A183EDF6_9BILA